MESVSEFKAQEMVAGPSWKYEWTTHNLLGNKLMHPYLSVSIEGSSFVSVSAIENGAEVIKSKEAHGE